MRDFSVMLLADGFLIGFTHFPKGDRNPDYDAEDWAEFNLYLGLIRLTWRFF
jgi:hypothetical protein|tara:strand:+ start:513 stop:668 length:156 start_codon:yes stop_codon:yes gene_type:complete